MRTKPAYQLPDRHLRLQPARSADLLEQHHPRPSPSAHRPTTSRPPTRTPTRRWGQSRRAQHAQCGARTGKHTTHVSLSDLVTPRLPGLGDQPSCTRRLVDRDQRRPDPTLSPRSGGLPAWTSSPLALLIELRQQWLLAPKVRIQVDARHVQPGRLRRTFHAGAAPPSNPAPNQCQRCAGRLSADALTPAETSQTCRGSVRSRARSASRYGGAVRAA